MSFEHDRKDKIASQHIEDNGSIDASKSAHLPSLPSLLTSRLTYALLLLTLVQAS